MKFTPNQDQQVAADEIFQFLLSDRKEHRLSGPGGVGKTYLMNHVMNDLLPLYDSTCALMAIPAVNYSIALTATTNKAAEVLQLTTGFPAETIHSFMNLTVKDDYSTGKTKITRTTNWIVHSKKLIFIDEASMLDSVLLRHILEGTDKTCKIIYVGDHCQLAPVFESVSPVYLDTSTSFSELRQPMRNAGQPALINLCNQLRNTVETGVFRPMAEVPGVIDYIDDAQAQNLIDTEFLHENNPHRILGYTNRKVQEYNEYIRGIRGYSDMFETGENLINNTGFSIGSTMLRPEEPILVTSADHTTEIMHTQGGGQIPYYTIKIAREKSPHSSMAVKIPVDPEHLLEVQKYYASQKQWADYFNLKNSFPDLRQKDAATVYKAQGSTYESVLIDLANIGTCNKYEQVARMLYVAVSRPTTRIYFYGNLPTKYQSGVFP